MKEQNRALEQILIELSKEIVNVDQVRAIMSNPTEFPMNLIEVLPLATALKYRNGQITYSEGDCIINNLYIYWTTRECIGKSDGFLGIAWECYLAFDSGEFYRVNDAKDIDPSEKYTKPLVESLLRKQKQIV